MSCNQKSLADAATTSENPCTFSMKKRKDKAEITEDEEDLEEKKRKLESRTFNIAVKFCDYWCTPLTKTMKISLMPADNEFKKYLKARFKTSEFRKCSVIHSLHP